MGIAIWRFRQLPERAAKSLRIAKTLRSLAVSLAAFCLCLGATNSVTGQVFDGLGSLPLQWQIAENDCRAKAVQHQIDATGGHDSRACEAMTVSAGHGTRLYLEYRIAPARVIDELAASLYVRSAQSGPRIGVRVRYPYIHDPETGRTVSVFLFGSAHRRAGEWDRLAIGDLPKRLREKEAALRVEYGTDADLRGAFVDAILLDIYRQPGVVTVRMDDLLIDNIVPVGNVSVAARPSFSGADAPLPTMIPRNNEPVAFPPQLVTRILEYNGEPLTYLRTLGFDAVLLGKPPTDEILREASRSRMRIYAPPPSAPNPDWEPLLEPVAGWYLGTSRDVSALSAVRAEAARVRKFPTRWQRGLFVAPAEAWNDYAATVPGLVYDLPPTTLGMSPAEEHDYLADARQRTHRPVTFAVGIQTAPPTALISQLDAFANSIGALPVEDYGWHPMWLQTMRALQQCPAAILFRSSRSLTSGLPVDQKRSLALGFINRSIDTIGPLLARATPAGTLPCTGAAYTAHRAMIGGTDVVLATTSIAGPVNVLAGDGAVLEIQLPTTMANRFAWRLTGMTAERLELENTPYGPSIQIVSPDAAEILLISDDTTLGHRISNRLAQLAMPAALDRWQLTSESVFQTRTDWDSVVASRLAPPEAMPAERMAAAANTLVEGEPMYRAGDGPMTLRLARRADAWMLRSREELLGALLPSRDVRYHFPAMYVPGGVPLQVTLSSQLQSGTWTRNLLAADAFDSPERLRNSGWTYDQRTDGASRSSLDVVQTDRANNVPGLRVEVVSTNDAPLPGGYAGTAVRVRSPAVECPADRLVRMSCEVHTLGFGGPFQGVLIYDSLGGTELGVLSRSPDGWQRVEIYRHTSSTTPLRLMFEIIGAGEAMFRETKIEMWDPRPADEKRLVPIRNVRLP